MKTKSDAIAAVYAHRSDIHQHLTRAMPFPYQDEYGANLITRFSILPPYPRELLDLDEPSEVPHNESEDPVFFTNVGHAYVLGLGVLAAAFVARHERYARAPYIEAIASLAIQKLMLHPSAPDMHRHPHVANAMRELSVVHAGLYDTVKRLQRQFLKLPGSVTGVLTFRAIETPGHGAASRTVAPVQTENCALPLSGT